MIFKFLEKLIKYYIDKLVSWLRVKKLQLELDNEIEKYHNSFEKKEKLKVKKIGKFGEDGWSISIGDIKDGD
tara:strand:- start:315 stop:530 length:216 start_codon:yes stop_codon:yes gene_type:complete